jgi:predicted HTH domain antitoxin
VPGTDPFSAGFWPDLADILYMTLTLPEDLEARLSPLSMALHLAIGLFVAEEATLGQAAQVAGLSQAEFLRELGKRRIPIHYGHQELAADLKAVESLAGR